MINKIKLVSSKPPNSLVVDEIPAVTAQERQAAAEFFSAEIYCSDTIEINEIDEFVTDFWNIAERNGWIREIPETFYVSIPMTDMTASESGKKLVLLYSGGLDSTVLLHMAAKFGHYEPHCLLIDYGQKHRRELETAQNWCESLSVPFSVCNISLPKEINSGLTGNNVGGQYEGVSPWHVPGRNTIFIGLAMSLAESIGASKIWYGANFADCLADFPDCLQHYVRSMDTITQIAGSRPIRLEAPLLGMTKETILSLASIFSIDPDHDVHSGYGE